MSGRERGRERERRCIRGEKTGKEREEGPETES